MSAGKPEKPGDKLEGSESQELKNSKGLKESLARLYHPRTLEVIEQIASLASTNEGDRKRLLAIVERQRMFIADHKVDPESINHQLPQTNFEGYVRNLLSDEGEVERESLIIHILQREELATASTIPPSMPRATTREISEKVGNGINFALKDGERLQRLHDEVFGEQDDSKLEVSKAKYIDAEEGDKFLVFRQKSDSIFPGDILTVTMVTFGEKVLIHLENEKGRHFTFDIDILKQIAQKANPYGDN